ncbi:diguanylate cyclase [Exiguobacterium sp. s46]|uniref:GGDEF domain-containing protein n=1 Tax=Exiguobacterium sp. s46 TaxID=2751200 RepID=UPI0033366C1F
MHRHRSRHRTASSCRPRTIVTAVQQTPFVMQDHAVSITVSAGIAYAHQQPAETVFKQADSALYEAKAQGRNQYRLYQSK